MTGPGKYDELCTLVRLGAKAQGAIIIVLHGQRGSGFSAQLPSAGATARLPQMLRTIADEIEADAQTMSNGQSEVQA